jgi:superfamily II DNA or RNA helicase
MQSLSPQRLVVDLASYVGGTVRSRGALYFQMRRVRLAPDEAGVLVANVRGSRLYEVRLSREGETLRATCTCPYFEDRGECCKHVWATVLTAAAAGRLADAGGRLPRRLAAGEVDYGVFTDDEDDWDDDDPSDDGYRYSEASEVTPAPRGGAPAVPRPIPRREPPAPSWRSLLARPREQPYRGRPAPAVEDLLYAISVPAALAGEGLVVEVLQRKRTAQGADGKPQLAQLALAQIAHLPRSPDQQVLNLLAGISPSAAFRSSWEAALQYEILPARCRIPEPVMGFLVPLLCATGRCRLRLAPQSLEEVSLAWQAGPPWELWLEVRRDEAARSYRVTGSLRRGEERMGLAEPVLMLRTGIVFTARDAAPLDHHGAFGWISMLRRQRELLVPEREGDELLEILLAGPDLPPLDLPEELRFTEVCETPRTRLRLWTPRGAGRDGRGDWLRGELSFGYGEREVGSGAPGRGIYERQGGRFLVRDTAAEAAAAARLIALGFIPAAESEPGRPIWRLHPSRLAGAVRQLLAAGWAVEAGGRPYRAPGAASAGVSSGIDWFELRGEVAFGGETVQLTDLLASLRRRDAFVPLGDGSLGLLPEEWLERFAKIAQYGRPEGQGVRFSSVQAGLLDALLAAAPEVTCDAAFAAARRRVQSFAGIQPAAAPAGFRGELRGYQREGLGWLHFLREFGFGGCLADDMGLGKTIQVLALLECRRTLPAGERRGPSLVVVPKSLVFNWLAEAARFTPELRVVNHTGGGRSSTADPFADCDLVLTTYGILRKDAPLLAATEFDYVVLDEAQAIKNADSQSAKAARLLRGRHRLALSGTPIENHLGELWSILEFLNPGVLGASPALRSRSAELRDPDAPTRDLLARALRPFILRRTKGQVAAELPAKVEQTLYCELPARQRHLYDQMRDYYRRSLSARIAAGGLGKAKILVLEALLRLRQIACHPGLVEPRRAEEPSAKLDLLLPHLTEVLEEGHKALVFSQFTSFLALLRRELERQGVAYEYLDGKTRDRQAPVERFQSDPECTLFLVSLKAGGLGLNLTAADYVYLLDPWWNPAVEAQAVDRTHRIGQTRRVFAYRLVARDTVEERILELQQGKRELADAVIRADQGLMRSLTREDLELLLS